MEEFVVTFILPYAILGLGCISVNAKLYGTALLSFGVFLSMLIWAI